MLEALAAVDATIELIEDRLGESLDLDRIAESVHYSKFHLNRLFSAEVGTSVHDYIVRRRLTAAAEAIIEGSSILDAALVCGYGSQQAFTAAFKAMYKTTPGDFRENGFFYPLQLRALVEPARRSPNPESFETRRAAEGDLGAWLEVVWKSVDCLPRLDFKGYASRLPEVVRTGGGIIAFDNGVPVGVAALSADARRINCLAVVPRYRTLGGYETLVGQALGTAKGEVSITTFRAGDRADTGQRKALEAIGFNACETLVDQGYPAQRYILSPTGRKETRCGSNAGFAGKGKQQSF